MNVLNHQRISELTKHRSPQSVSIFMPTHRAGHERQQDDIRLKNVVKHVEDKLQANNISSDIIDQLLEPILNLQSDDSFWEHRSDGLACFASPEAFYAYRVPISLDEQWFVNERFHVRPLLPLLRSDSLVYILCLTQESARLYEATKFAIREIELPEIPRLELDGNEKTLQYHSHNAPAHGKGATHEAIYHGHGGEEDRSKKDTQKFFQLVDRAVSKVLQGQKAPLVLACVGYLAPIYESANTYGNLASEPVAGSPDNWNDDELRTHAWQLLEPRFQEQKRKAWESFQEAQSHDRGSDDLSTVVLASNEGRVESLFLVNGEQRWGHVDPTQRTVHLANDQSEGEELLDYAAVQSLTNGGEIFLLDTLPETDSPIAATFRY